MAGGVVRIAACTRELTAACPDCGRGSARVHSRYGRMLADVAAGGRPVLIGLSVRRLFCDSPGCGRRTFAEQVEGLTALSASQPFAAAPGGDGRGATRRPGRCPAAADPEGAAVADQRAVPLDALAASAGSDPAGAGRGRLRAVCGRLRNPAGGRRHPVAD
ncbi:transposase family protein [Streptomyces sp. HUCO-GS316]|uniref:transposase family protein n=1 Tax=Streptomyces sp. HUCO-GS316 TaxID=2692198 RepID=UPI001927E779